MGRTRAEPLVDVDRPVRVAVLTSLADARLRHLLEADPNYGVTYELVGGVVNVEDSAAADLLAGHDVPVEVRDIHAFYEEQGAPLTDVDVRQEFDAGIAETLGSYDPDLVVLSGYLHVVTAPVLDRFFPRIVNVHHGDLTVRDEAGVPVYTGLDAVEDALRAGEAGTHETTHLVTEAVDRGPIVARSRPFTVHRGLVAAARERGDDDVLSAYVYAHREWMIREGGGPTLEKTIELVADGRVTYDPDEEATRIDGRRGYYQLGEGVVGAGPPDGDD